MITDERQTMIRDEIENRLRSELNPEHLDVRDISAAHAGHAGAPDGGESHFEVDISASAFPQASRIQAHRTINRLLADLLAGPVHALQITLIKQPE